MNLSMAADCRSTPSNKVSPENQYVNFNLNRNSPMSMNPSSEIHHHHLQKKIDFDPYFESRGRNRWTNSEKKCDSLSFNRKLELSNYFKDVGEKRHKRWNKTKVSNETVSTLSIHIAAYENSVETPAKKESSFVQKLSLKDPLGTKFPKAIAMEDAFEFPRGRVKPQPIEPEVMQFKATQKLFNPNSTAKTSVAKPIRLDPNDPSTKQHYRHLLLAFYNQNPQITGKEMVKKIEELYGKNAINERTCRRWKNKFENGEKDVTNLNDNDRSGRPQELNDELLRQAIADDPSATIDMLVERMGFSHGTVYNHLHQIGLKYKLGRWVPHRLTLLNMMNRMQIASSLLNRYRENNLRLDDIVTCDEKWCLYVNILRRGQWVLDGSTPDPTPRPDLHPKKCLLSLFWDTEGVLLWEIVPHGQLHNHIANN